MKERDNDTTCGPLICKKDREKGKRGRLGRDGERERERERETQPTYDQVSLQ